MLQECGALAPCCNRMGQHKAGMVLQASILYLQQLSAG
jgi:hypothetical protein